MSYLGRKIPTEKKDSIGDILQQTRILEKPLYSYSLYDYCCILLKFHCIENYMNMYSKRVCCRMLLRQTTTM